MPFPRLRALVAPATGRRALALERELEDTRAELEAQNEQLKSTLEALWQEKDRLEAFFDFGASLAERTDVEGLGRAILERIAELARAEFGVVHVRRGDQYALVATRGLPSETLPENLEEGVDLAGIALAERRAVSAESGPGEQLCLPLLHRGRPLGVLTLLRSGRPLTVGLRHTIEHLLGQAAVALSNALAYEEARRQTVILTAVLDATRDPIRMVDRSGRRLLENSAARELQRALDFAPDLSAGELAALAAPLVEDPDAFLETYRQIAENECFAGMDEYRFLESGRSIQRYTAPVVEPGGKIAGRILVLRDVTAERESERLKDEFVALVSHELRTPLTSIIGYVETLLEGEVGELTEEQDHFLRVVDRNAERLLGLVGDLLFVANLDAGAIGLEPQELDLGRLVAECVEAARPDAESRGIVLDLDGPEPGLPVDGDPARLGQVLDNLISNALKFTPAGGRVSVGVRAAGSSVSVEIEDTGIGIPEAEQERLFDRFYRASSATARAIPGSGLGLSVARAIVEGHDGTIGVSSVDGQGSTFWIELPAKVSATNGSSNSPLRAGR